MTETESRTAESAKRLRHMLTGGAPRVVLMQECNLLVSLVADMVGPVTVRTWLDERLDAAVAALSLCRPSGTCPGCNGIGRTVTADGRNPACRTCHGVGLV